MSAFRLDDFFRHGATFSINLYEFQRNVGRENTKNLAFCLKLVRKTASDAITADYQLHYCCGTISCTMEMTSFAYKSRSLVRDCFE